MVAVTLSVKLFKKKMVVKNIYFLYFLGARLVFLLYGTEYCLHKQQGDRSICSFMALIG